MLPGVLMSRDRKTNPFLCQLADLGSRLQHAQLRDAARNLIRLLPADPQTSERIFSACQMSSSSDPQQQQHQQHQQLANNITTKVSPVLENLFFGASPSAILYYLEVFVLHLFSING